MTNFCIDLTGITQETVENGSDFPTALSEHKKWLLKHLKKEPTIENVLMITCGDWDLRKMIDVQCKHSKLQIPKYFHQWCNLKILYSEFLGKKAHGMTDMLSNLSLELKGRHHSGIDDCLNIAQVVSTLFAKGCPMIPTTVRSGKKISNISLDLKIKKNYLLFDEIKNEENKVEIIEKIEEKEFKKDNKGRILIHVHTLNNTVLFVPIDKIDHDEIEKCFDIELEKQKLKIKKKEFYFRGKKIDQNSKLTNESIVYLSNDQSHKLYNQVLEFSKSKQEEMEFPNTLNNFERRFIHSIAEDFGLFSESKGEKSKRVLILSKNRNNFKYKKNMPFGMSEIIDEFLYLGSGADVLDNDQLVKNKITHVLNLTEEWRKPLKNDLEFKRIPLKDVENQSIIEHFETAFEYIDQVKKVKKGKILVHCVIGKSRSASFVIAYVMKEMNMDFNKAFNYVVSKRDFIKPNEGFVQQLKEFEKILSK